MENQNHNMIPCKCCGAKLTYAPGTMNLKCEFCGTENEIAIDEARMAESKEWRGYTDFLADMDHSDDVAEIHTVKCNCCGAETTFDQNVISSKCDFCGAPITVEQKHSRKLIKPQAVVPFKVAQQQAQELFRNWIKDLWFAPGDLKKSAEIEGGLTGMYLPYWDYMSWYAGEYEGERGDYYYTEEKTKDAQGNETTRKVRHTRWTPKKGYIHNHTDEIFVPGSKSLPSIYLEHMGKWNLEEAVPFDEKFLSGFKTETYSVDIKVGYEEHARPKVEQKIDEDIRERIGGDEQRISLSQIEILQTFYKHIILPIWLSSFRYNGKSYQFVVNGQNGTLRGDRPYSVAKIAITIISVIAAIAALILIFKK
ncbi:MAG: hypothetical protein MJZ61_01215 [Bacteroidales bacterium]|nr:hypothetical protein [Bacteroidales bacterium]